VLAIVSLAGQECKGLWRGRPRLRDLRRGLKPRPFKTKAEREFFSEL
jgi:hypothetical protein